LTPIFERVIMPNMNEEFREESPGDVTGAVTSPAQTPTKRNVLAEGLETLARLGLGETMLRFGTLGMSLAAVVIVIFFLRFVFTQASPTLAAEAIPTQSVQVTPPNAPAPDVQTYAISHPGIARFAQPYTSIPTRPRVEITTYTVQAGDTVFGISERYNLKPQTILWGNYNTLRDDPHNLRPGQVLTILPTDGTYYEWQATDGLNAVARFFGVTPEDIINYPTNNLSPETIGDYTRPNIEPGAWLVIPGGKREFVAWSAPIGVTRQNPGLARILGAGACGVISTGAVGYGSFVWPSGKRYLSGFDYSPETNHRGLDIAGNLGEAIYAVDAGVIVYSGWNDWGYGYMVMVDHGNGWQSLYAHMSSISVGCGESVGQGTVIGAVGSTGRSSGPHLHFELMHTAYGKVNPWDFLPPP
jgi:murein DD-endopeptidase MepM/ murein hydrolase activator NlpD